MRLVRSRLDIQESIYKYCDQRFGLESDGLFYVHFPDISYSGPIQDELYCGKLRDILDLLMQGTKFIREDHTFGYIYKAEITYVDRSKGKIKFDRQVSKVAGRLKEYLNEINMEIARNGG